ncbi:MAG: DUF3891 family protein [Chitinophagaceae bacterium]|nr:MAG: DUF3891 family protein [Chitinophagaceae bacterium]
MIVKYREEGWEIVTQRSHGIVAAQIGFNWKFGELPAHWVEVMMSIAEHDDAENELDGENLLTATGGPLNYDMKKFDLEHCMNLASLTIVKSRTIALLTSLHMEFLYASAKPENKKAVRFLADQKKLRSQWMKELSITEKQTMELYNLLQWCDALSLLICKDDMQEEQRKTEISVGPHNVTYYLTKIDEHTLTVEPWPFACEKFPVYYERRHLPRLVFSSSAEFRDQFLASGVEMRSWDIKKGTGKKRARNATVLVES